MADIEFPPEGIRDDVKPGSPSIENAAFVLLGVASAIAVLLRLAGVFS